MDEWTNKRDGKSSHSTGLCPLSGLLPKTTMQSICYLKLPWVCLGTIYPICDHDPNSPKMAKNMPETTSYTLSTSDMISMLLYHSNQLPIGIKWSAVPLPCSTFLGFLGESMTGATLEAQPAPIGAAALLPSKKTKKISFENKSRVGQGNR